MCFGWRITEYMSTGQNYSDENPHNCHGYKDKLFAPSFDMWCPISNSISTKVVIATCKENQLNGAAEHLKCVCNPGKRLKAQKRSWGCKGAAHVPLSVSRLVFPQLQSFSNNINLLQCAILLVNRPVSLACS